MEHLPVQRGYGLRDDTLTILIAHLPSLLTITCGTTWTWTKDHGVHVYWNLTPTTVIDPPLPSVQQLATSHSATLCIDHVHDLQPLFAYHLERLTQATSWTIHLPDFLLTQLTSAMIRFKVSAPSTLSGPFPDILSGVFLSLRHEKGQSVWHLHLLPVTMGVTCQPGNPVIYQRALVRD